MGIYIEKSQEGKKKLEDTLKMYHTVVPSKSLISSIKDEDGHVCTLGPSTLETDSTGWLITGRGHTMAELLFALDKHMSSLTLEKNISTKIEADITTHPNIFN